MATPIKMPDLGTNVEDVRLVEWLKQEGDSVRRGEPLCEVETDKATDELESVAEGVLLRQTVPGDSEVQSGQIIAWVGQPGEEIPEPGDSEPTATTAAADVEPQPGTTDTPATRVPTSPAKVSLVIRNLASREGVDLAKVTGTGPGGQITRDDVLRAKQAVEAGEAGGQGEPLPKDQLSVARRVSRSNREVPTIDLMVDVDMTALLRIREESARPSSQKVSFDGFFLYAVARAITQYPGFAAHVNDERLFAHEAIDVCLAVSRDNSLCLPVVRRADQLTLSEIHLEVRRLAEKTRAGHLRLADLSGGCFTVSNLGMYGTDAFQMIIPAKQSGALAIGTTRQRPVVEDGQIVARPMCTLGLSVDHRMINGAMAAEFLKHVKETLETL